MVRSLIRIYLQSKLTLVFMTHSRFRQELPHVSYSSYLASDRFVFVLKMILHYDSSLVVQDLLRPHLDMQKGLAFFYCSRTSGQIERQEPKDMLCSIVRQLSSPVPGLPLKPPVIIKHEQETLIAKPPATLSLKQSKRLIEKLIQDEYSSVTIVIDALDECNSKKRGDLFRFLGDLLELPGTIVKIFVSSRNEPDIFDVFGHSDNLYIDASNNAEDIRNFVEQEVETRLLGGKAEDGLKELVKVKLCEKAQGM